LSEYICESSESKKDLSGNKLLELVEVTKLSSKKYNRQVINGIKDDLDDATLRMMNSEQNKMIK